MEYLQTKRRLFELLQTGHRVTVHWDCGGDESFVYTSIDGQEQESTYEAGDFAYEVEQLLTEELELPGVGEFSMTGDGHFFLEGRGVGLDYQSTAEVYDDELTDDFYDDFTDEQLAEMGLERPAPKADAPEAAAPVEAAAEPSAADEESSWMSEEYSGRRILFELPAA